ncbi:MAG: hypothetical protein ACJ74Y_07680 [Bryobacteraceae bacterium]
MSNTEIPVLSKPNVREDMTGVNTPRMIRSVFWICALILGAAQTWSVRHAILSDGISYIEIAQAYLRRDWMNALNAYWSPLYSWLIACAFAVLHPKPYWEVATAHLVLFAAFVASLFSFEYFLRELIAFLRSEESGRQAVSPPALYVAGYSVFLFGGLWLVGTWYCSPDMIAFALMFYLTGAILRVQRTGGADSTFLGLGIASALFFLARTAFLPSLAVLFCIILALRWRRRLPLLRPASLFIAPVLVLAAPFVIAISVKSGALTIGESGRLNYGWEVDGASRLIHWQGEPFDIGTPKHPTRKVVDSPATFVFASPIASSYPPWYDPSYWYAGIHPKLKPGRQIRILFVNLTVALNVFVRSPLTLPVFLLILLIGKRRWWGEFLKFWPVLTFVLFGMALYCLVYFEKRYIAGNLVLSWVLLLATLRFENPGRRKFAQIFVVVCSLGFVLLFVGRKQVHALRVTASDLIGHREHEVSVDDLLAKRVTQLGLRPGDKVAFIGSAINAYWAHLASVKIVSEVPLLYGRSERPLNNFLIDDTRQIQAFWQADPQTRERVLQAFRDAGAVMVVSDGVFCKELGSQWPRVLPETQPDIPKLDPNEYSQINARYFPLIPLQARSMKQ